MIIQTRYRDIDYEEARQCFTYSVSEEEWNNRRGKTISIKTPSVVRTGMKCEGPFFLHPTLPNYCVCAHIAQIGD